MTLQGHCAAGAFLFAVLAIVFGIQLGMSADRIRVENDSDVLGVPSIVVTEPTPTERRHKDNFSLDQSELNTSTSPALRSLFNDASCVNSTAFEDKNKDTNEIEFVGSKTEGALLRFEQTLEWEDYRNVREAADVVHMVPFSSERKAIGGVMRLSDNRYWFYAKGASEILTKLCSSLIIGAKLGETPAQDDHIETKDTDEFARDNVQWKANFNANQSLRTIALCYRDLAAEPPHGVNPEAGIRYAIEKCVKASVSANVEKCICDNALTARSIVGDVNDRARKTPNTSLLSSSASPTSRQRAVATACLGQSHLITSIPSSRTDRKTTCVLRALSRVNTARSDSSRLGRREPTLPTSAQSVARPCARSCSGTTLPVAAGSVEPAGSFSEPSRQPAGPVAPTVRQRAAATWSMGSHWSAASALPARAACSSGRLSPKHLVVRVFARTRTLRAWKCRRAFISPSLHVHAASNNITCVPTMQNALQRALGDVVRRSVPVHAVRRAATQPSYSSLTCVRGAPSGLMRLLGHVLQSSHAAPASTPLPSHASVQPRSSVTLIAHRAASAHLVHSLSRSIHTSLRVASVPSSAASSSSFDFSGPKTASPGEAGLDAKSYEVIAEGVPAVHHAAPAVTHSSLTSLPAYALHLSLIAELTSPVLPQKADLIYMSSTSTSPVIFADQRPEAASLHLRN